MTVRVMDVADPSVWEAAIGEAQRVTAKGGIVVLPTDTVYGVGADPYQAQAVAAVLALKGRDGASPSPVLVGSAQDVPQLGVEVTDAVAALMGAYWPGALTIIVPTTSQIARNLGAKADTIAVRMPGHPFALALLRATGPLAVTSANQTGAPPATTRPAAQEALGAGVDLYLDAGPTPGPVASTIVDLTGDVPRIVRQGLLDSAEVLTIARPVQGR